MSGKNNNILECTNEINRFLSDYPYENNHGDAIFIHRSIFPKFKDRLLSCGCELIENVNYFEYNIVVGQVLYEMYLIWINLNVMIKSQLHLIVTESKYSFPWESNITIYTIEQEFGLVEMFIRQNKLGKFVRNIYTDSSRLCIQNNIKVVEFTNEINRNLLPTFRTYLEKNVYQLPHSYFAARAFKYLRPSFLAYLDRPHYNQDTITTVLLLLEYHRTQLAKGKQIFNLFDLIAMKMAIDDNRFEYVNCEFRKLIAKLLESLDSSFLDKSSKVFFLYKYHGDLGMLGYSEEMYQYLITQFSVYFDKVKVKNYGKFKIKPKRIFQIDNMLSRSRYYKKLGVDVASIDAHNSEVLYKLFTYDELKCTPTLSFKLGHPLEIDDVTQRTVTEFPARDLHFKKPSKKKLKKLKKKSGANYVNMPTFFIENLLNWMKLTMGSNWANFDLRFIQSDIESPIVLRGLTVRMIILKEIRITCKLLRALHHVDYKIIKLSKCFLEDDPTIFMLVDMLKGDRYIQINIEDHTLQLLMDSIPMILLQTGRRQFQFQSYITVYYLKSDFEFIDLSRFKFFVNDEGTKIETIDLYTNEVVNLYDYFYKSEEPEGHFYN